MHSSPLFMRPCSKCYQCSIYIYAHVCKKIKRKFSKKEKGKKNARTHARKKLGTSGTFGTKVHEYWVCADFEFVTFVPNVPYFNHQICLQAGEPPFQSSKPAYPSHPFQRSLQGYANLSGLISTLAFSLEGGCW